MSDGVIKRWIQRGSDKSLSVEFELGMKIECFLIVPFPWEESQSFSEIGQTAIWTEWNTTNMQIGCIPNPDSTEKLNL